MILNYVKCIRGEVYGLIPETLQCSDGKKVKRLQQRRVKRVDQ